MRVRFKMPPRRVSRSGDSETGHSAFQGITSRKLCTLLFLIFLLTFGCKEPAVQPQNKYLVSYQNIFFRPAAELKSLLAGTGLTSLLTDDVTLYAVTYKTTFKNQVITASGLVALPKTTQSVPMVSFQHGTIAALTEAPTLQPLGSTELTLYTGLASAGFIAVIPDFIGFGSSSNIPHPYYVEEVTASAITDMIQAAKELATGLSIKFNGKLFLAGYSQGGFATMAAHKSIEQNSLPGFTLTASFPAAGGYDVKAMQEYFFGLTTYDQPFYLAYVANAYKNQYTNWTQGLSEFFNEPYATKIPGLFDGSKGSSEINAQLTTSVSGLIRADLLTKIDTDPKYKYVVDAFKDNSLVDWKPVIKMYLYHGDADVTVPYNNSVITYNKLIANGATTSILSLTTLPGANHGTGVLPYIQNFVPIMVSLK